MSADQVHAEMTTDFASAITLDELIEDPYPIYKELRASDPVAWVPAAGLHFVTRHEDVRAISRDLETFSVADGSSLSGRVMGPTMNRREGADHLRERKAAEPPIKPRTVGGHWVERFQEIADHLIDGFADRGEGDLIAEFAAPYAAICLREVLGLPDAAPEDMLRWSAALIAGSSNYADDPDVWREADRAASEIADQVDEAIARCGDDPAPTVISSMINAAEPLERQAVRNNIRLFVSGGLNEPRDVCGTGIYACLSHPEQRRLLEEDHGLFEVLFEESLRWTSPVGLLTRRVTRDTELGGHALAAGTRVGVMLASANRDENAFERPDDFDLRRGKTSHVAFNGGAHMCLGMWMARAQLGKVAFPTLLRRLPGLSLRDPGTTRFSGWVFRALPALPVRWEVAK